MNISIEAQEMKWHSDSGYWIGFEYGKVKQRWSRVNNEQATFYKNIERI
jgi:hypothetical protein